MRDRASHAAFQLLYRMFYAAAGEFEVEVAGTYVIQCFDVKDVRCAVAFVPRAMDFTAVLSWSQYYIDGQLYRGDPYALNWWFGTDGWLTWPVALSAGTHTIKVCSLRYTRSMTSCVCVSYTVLCVGALQRHGLPMPVREHDT